MQLPGAAKLVRPTCIPRTRVKKGHQRGVFLWRARRRHERRGATGHQRVNGRLGQGRGTGAQQPDPPRLPRAAANCQATPGCRPPGQTLESAALANEAYLKLVRAGGVRCESRVQFLALCSQIIRRILADDARNRGYSKRGGGVVQIALDEEVVAAESHQVDVLALDEALTSLFEFDPRKARVVELRYFGGLSIEETAEALGISPETAKRDWKMAKAWLLES
jgi:RNA polymerase sigma-70 factor, ECF subfamily